MSPNESGAVLARSNSGKPMNNLQLVDNLCSSSAVLREARRVHVKSFGTLIPHVFMADVLARVGSLLLMGGAHAILNHRPEIEGILAALEQGLATGDRETRNVIAVSFARDSELELFFDELKPLLGPKIRAQLRGR